MRVGQNCRLLCRCIYDIIYAKMVDARVAVSIEEVFTNKIGEISSKGEKYGRGNNIKSMYPKYICFMDETGCNTSQKKIFIMRAKGKLWELITFEGQNAIDPITVLTHPP